MEKRLQMNFGKVTSHVVLQNLLSFVKRSFACLTKLTTDKHLFFLLSQIVLLANVFLTFFSGMWLKILKKKWHKNSKTCFFWKRRLNVCKWDAKVGPFYMAAALDGKLPVHYEYESYIYKFSHKWSFERTWNFRLLLRKDIHECKNWSL